MAGIPLIDIGKPLQLPDPIKQPTIDFKPLDKIGDAIAESRVQNATAEALARATGPDGKVNFDMAGAELGKMGMLDQAKPFLDLAMRKTALAQSNAQHADTIAVQSAHNRATEANAAETLRLARDAYENPKPTVHQAWNPATGQMEFYETRPGAPVKNMSQATAAAAPQPQAAAAVPQPQTAAPPNNPTTVLAQDGTPPAVAAPAAAPPAAAAAAPAATPAVAPPGTTSSTSPGVKFNDAALTGLAPNRAELVKKVSRYEINPASLSTKGGEREYIMGKAAEYDPSFDQTFYSTKQRTLGAFGAGPEARTLRAVTNLTEHLDTAEELVKALANPNTGPTALNPIINKFRSQFGYTPPTNLAAAAPIIGGEITKVVAGVGAGGVAERAEAAASILSQAKTEKQALDAIGVIKQLMGGQIHGLEQQYKSGTRLNDFRDKLTPGARKILESREGKTTEAPKSAAPALDEATVARLKANPIATVRMAQDALAKGKDRAAVEAMLTAAGIDPKVLDARQQ